MILYTKNLQPNLRMSNSGRKIGSASLRHEIVVIENEALFSELLDRRVQITSSNHRQPTNRKLTSTHTWVLDKGVGGEKFERMYLNAISTENLKRCFCRDVSKWNAISPHLEEDWVKEEVPGLRAAGRVCDQALSDEIFLLLVLQGLDALLDGFCCHLIQSL